MFDCLLQTNFQTHAHGKRENLNSINDVQWSYLEEKSKDVAAMVFEIFEENRLKPSKFLPPYKAFYTHHFIASLLSSLRSDETYI